jgi:ABC-2 type transport system ATP-binding protein
MKVSLGGALIHNPKMLVLDEPFVNLDIGTTEKIMQILKSFKGKKTIFITSHQLELVADLCDRFLIMDKGHIVAELNKQDYESLEVLKNHVKQFLVKEDNNINLSWLG